MAITVKLYNKLAVITIFTGGSYYELAVMRSHRFVIKPAMITFIVRSTYELVVNMVFTASLSYMVVTMPQQK
jgi:hypothetical protein